MSKPWLVIITILVVSALVLGYSIRLHDLGTITDHLHEEQGQLEDIAKRNCQVGLRLGNLARGLVEDQPNLSYNLIYQLQALDQTLPRRCP